MSQPIRVLLPMLIVLGALVALVVALGQPLLDAFLATPWFNGLILAVFALGIAVNLRGVLRLQGEVRWIEAFRRANPERPPTTQPVLLSPMAKLLSHSERKPQSLSTASMRSLLDSIYLRLEEQRDLSRYLIGLLIFLGLLGTFWGLLLTIASVAEIIAGLSAGSDALAMFDALKTRLREPLAGMATSFSTSLFGLAGSLVLGLLDLFAGRASNRFYSELEDWLSGMTRLSSGSSFGGDGDTSVPAYVQALLEQTADGLERMQRAIVENDRERRSNNEQLAELNSQLARLAESQTELRATLRTLAQQEGGMSEDLRSELRLLSRTIANSLKRDS
ncbi:flagellar motor protein MotA [Pseudomarimonas salicorniae]|uniref:Flagellar motor protein MotA n=1 Tax=Pseudomarimonas salicorniae TaxID=2933270 RepID=A0ABT0GG51_9GAMM|nr:flagellar motor protein MotA [Lysobacter sp. CAU 1642]MCK7593506.1 flagellar motor protein MotA [Lysobacter sp. CAU 1642]